MQKRKFGEFVGLLIFLAALGTTRAMAGPLDSLQPGQWYQFANSNLSAVFPSPLPDGNPAAIMGYSGGTFDTKRNRLIVWGGGHAGYAGNEIYAFSVADGKWTRLTNPSSSPVAVHTYDHLEYLPKQDTFFAPGGSQWGSGSAVQGTWLFNFASGSWSNAGPMPGDVYSFWYFNMTTDYDPLSDKVIVIGAEDSGTFDGASKTWTLTGEGHGALGLSGAFDTKRRKFVDVGRGNAYVYSVSAGGAPGARQSLSTSGPQTIVNCDAPGFAYDPVTDRFVGWCSGSNVYSLNMDTLAWTQHAATNSVNPGAPYVEGTFGRFAYMPDYNAFIVVNDAYGSVYAYKLSNGTGSVPTTPSVSLSANPTVVTAGGSVTLSWSAENVTSCTASSNSGIWTGSKGLTGPATVGPLTSTGNNTFSLDCTGPNGPASSTTQVSVQAASTGGSTGGGTSGGSGGSSTSGGTGSGSGVSADSDWAIRANSPGVVRAIGFDTQAEWLNNNYDTSSCNPQYAPGCRENAWDPNVKASGAGSVRFDVLSRTGEGDAGNIAVNFSTDNSVQFGANSEFWIQWRQRFDDYMISHNYREVSGNGEWKQVIIAQGDRRLSNGSTLIGYACSENQIVVQNQGGVDFPGSYIECGRYSNFDDYDGNGRYTKQNQRKNASGNYNCIYYPQGDDTSGCLKYLPNQWMTFMVHITLGPEGRAVSNASGESQPGFINSQYELYVAREGGPLEIAHRENNLVVPKGQHWDPASGVNPDNPDDPGYTGGWTAHDGHPDAKFGKLWLTPYHTGKDGSEVTENASTWYDEVIISRQRIPDPGATSGSSTPTPTATLSASPMTVTSGSPTTLTWSSQNASSCAASGGWSGTKATSGTQTIALTATTTFNLSCGGSAPQAVTVTVQSSSGSGGSGSGSGSGGSGSGSGGSGSGGGTSGGGSSTGGYTMLLDVPGGNSGLALSGQAVSGVARVYVMPESGVSSVDYLIDGTFQHSEYYAPYELGGSTFDFSTLSGGGHTVTAVVHTTAGQNVTVNAAIQVGSGSTGGSTGGGSTGGGSSGGSSGGGSAGGGSTGSGSGAATNQPPATPQLSLAGGALPLGDGQIDVSAPYADPDGDNLMSAEWQIALDQGFGSLVLSRLVPGPGRTALPLAAGVLEPGRLYWVRTRHRDVRGGLSAWSPAVSANTGANMPGDADGNGVVDSSQVDGDANNNGVRDATEGICDLLDSQSNSVVGLATDVGEMQCYRAISPSEAGLPPAGLDFPYGLFSFRVDGLPVNPANPARVTLRVHLPQKPSGAVKWYKLDAASGTLFELASNVAFEGNTALVELVDGGLGDFDGVINGVIVDPSGPLTITAASGTGGDAPSSGSGSSSGASSIGVLMPVLMAVAGLARRRAGRPRRAA